eukprot:1679227-Pleurochrysis_carterae.AAC.1
MAGTSAPPAPHYAPGPSTSPCVSPCSPGAHFQGRVPPTPAHPPPPPPGLRPASELLPSHPL